MTTKTEVSKAQAEAVVAEVERVFRSYMRHGVKPTLLTGFDGRPFTIVWEEGPYEWPYRFPFGGIDEELTALSQEFQPGAVAKTPEADLPDGVWTEPINHYSIGIYPKESG